MNWLRLLISISLLLGIETKEIETNDINLNSNFDSDQLRKALLKALTELENEDQSKANEDNNEDAEINSKTIFYSTTARTEESDRIVEKASASALSFFTKEKVDASTEKLDEENAQIFTKQDSGDGHFASTVTIFGRNGGFSATTEHILEGGFTPEGFKQEETTVNEERKQLVGKKSAGTQKFAKNADEVESKPSSTLKPLVIIQKSSGVQHRPIISVLNESEDNEEGFVASASGGNPFTNKNNYASKSSENFISKTSVNKNKLTSGIKTVSITPKPDASVTTTLTPTSSTEESEAKAEDVQFFSAPLVAAFTVHQDERGLPKKVEPIYKTASTASPNTQKQEINQQLDLHEKQKVLEQEILKLQQQRNQHELLLRQIQQQNFVSQGTSQQQTFGSQGTSQQQNFGSQGTSQQQNFIASNQFQQNFGSQTERPFIPIVSPLQTTSNNQQGNQFFATTPNPNANNQFFGQQNFANQVSITKSQQQVFPGNQQTFHGSSVFNQVSGNDGSLNSNLVNQISITNPPPINQIATNNLLNQNQFSGSGFVDNKNVFNQNSKNNQNFNQVQLNQNNFDFNKQFNQNFQNAKNQFSQSFDNKQKGNGFGVQNGFNPPLKKFNTLVSLQPSVAVNPTAATALFSGSNLPLNAQIPPNKNAVDFRPHTNQFLPTPLIQPHQNNFGKVLPDDNNLGKILSPPPQQQEFAKFQSQGNFIQHLPHVQSTRVFRQEQHTGNLGLNSQFNSQNQFSPIIPQTFALSNNNNQFNQNFGFNHNNQFNNNNNFQPTRFFRSNQESFQTNRNQHHHQQNINQHLNNLLYNSGITRNVRQNDDLNIVSKILSYNVGRDNYFSGSRNSEQRIVPKVK